MQASHGAFTTISTSSIGQSSTRAASSDLEERLAWLARVLEAREFPLPRLARNLELAAAVVRDDLPSSKPSFHD